MGSFELRDGGVNRRSLLWVMSRGLYADVEALRNYQ